MSVTNKTVFNQIEQDRIWRHYQIQAKDTFDLSYPRLRFLAKRCLPGTRVLNIGVGSGYLDKLLAARGVEVYSLDPCGESVCRLRIELNMGERVKQGYSQDIPFDAGYFDQVIMTEVLEHLSDDILHATLDEVSRVLKPKGEFVGTVPYCEELKANEVICPHCQLQFHRWGHQQSFNIASLKLLFKKHGFYVKKIYSRTFPDFGRPLLICFFRAVFRYVLGRMGESLVSPNLYFIARVG